MFENGIYENKDFALAYIEQRMSLGTFSHRARPARLAYTLRVSVYPRVASFTL
ncbi:MAG: hypothetical protein K0R92_323 [Lachnospiraceae bacterium]|jgi:hypothetical protein|nr:hypothetical protein [Lachnospiraceae bacterium]